MHFTTATVIGLALCVALGIIPAIRTLLAQRPRPFVDEPEPEPSRAPYLRPGPEEPEWWPRFEREFAGYVALGDAARPPSD